MVNSISVPLGMMIGLSFILYSWSKEVSSSPGSEGRIKCCCVMPVLVTHDTFIHLEGRSSTSVGTLLVSSDSSPHFDAGQSFCSNKERYIFGNQNGVGSFQFHTKHYCSF